MSESDTHKRGVEYASRWMLKAGYSPIVWSGKWSHDPDGYGHRPSEGMELYARYMLIEVETCTSAKDDDARDQLATFTDWKAADATRRMIVLFVPDSCVEDAEATLPGYDLYEGFPAPVDIEDDKEST